MNFIDIFVFIVALSVLVIFHEFGHLLFAKLFGVYCYEFSLGMGPRLLTKKIGSTYYSLKLLLIGGSVAMAGETPTEAIESSDKIYGVQVKSENTIYGIAKPKRLAIMSAGAIFNIVLGYFLFMLSLGTGGVANKANKLNISNNSIAYNTGLRSNVTIEHIKISITKNSTTKICYSDVTSKFEDIFNAFNSVSEMVADEQCRFSLSSIEQVILTDNNKKDFVLERTHTGESTPLLGIGQASRSANIGELLTLPFSQMLTASTAIIGGFVKMFTNFNINNMSGPVGILNVSSQVSSYGFSYYLAFMGLLTINLGIFNLIPFPGLDGSLVFITLIEMVTKKEVPKKVKGLISYIGILLLLLLIIVITIKDVSSLSFLS
jgi:regulator of sigma E protease